MRTNKWVYAVVFLIISARVFAQAGTCGKSVEHLPGAISFRMTSGSGILRGYSSYLPTKEGELPTLYRKQSWNGSINRKYYCAWSKGDKHVLSGANEVLDDGTLVLGKTITGYTSYDCTSGGTVTPFESDSHAGSLINTAHEGGFTMPLHCRGAYADPVVVTQTEVRAHIDVVGAPACSHWLNNYRETGDTVGTQVERLSSPDSVESALGRTPGSESSEVMVGLHDFTQKAPQYKSRLGAWEKSDSLEITIESATAVTVAIRFDDLCVGDYILKYVLLSQEISESGEVLGEPIRLNAEPKEFEVTHLNEGKVEVEVQLPLIEGQAVWLEEVPVALSSSACASEATKSNHALGSVQWNVSLGKKNAVDNVGAIWLLADEIDESLLSPSALTISSRVKQHARVIYDGSIVRQIMAPEVFVDILETVPGESFEVRMYAPEEIAVLQGDLYEVGSAQPIVTYQFAPMPSAAARSLEISEVRNGHTDSVAYLHSPENDEWSMSRAGGDSIETLKTESSGELTIVTRVIQNQSGDIAYKATEVRRDIAGFERLVERVEDPDGEALTTQWLYDEDPESLAYGKLIARTDPSGYWERYQYHPERGVVNQTISQYKDAPLGAPVGASKVETVAWSTIPDQDGDGLDEDLKTERILLLGQEVSCLYTIDFSNVIEVVDVEEIYLLDPDLVDSGSLNDFIKFIRTKTLYKDRWTIQCLVPGASWDDVASTHVTKTRFYAEGAFAGHIRYKLGPDGILSHHEYELDLDGSSSMTVDRGVPVGSELSHVTEGVRTYTEFNSAGKIVLNEIVDIDTGIAYEIKQAIDFDEKGRVTEYAYLNGTTTKSNYSCCGLDNETDIYGKTTYYFYDDLDRLESTEKNGVTTEYTYDAAGRRTRTTLIAADGSEMIQSESVYTPSGDLDYTLDALGRLTDYERSVNASGQTVRTVLNPDGGTTIETYYPDGQLESVSGTAAYPVRYEYGVITDTHDGRTFNARYTKEIKVDPEGAEDEFSITYSDMVGRTYKTEYPKLTAPGTCQSLNFYNTKGQLIRSVGPSGQATLYAYDARGRRIITAQDVNGNALIDFDGPDRIVRNLESILHDAERGAVIRSTSEVWEMDGVDSAELVSVSDRSLTSLQSWNTQYGQTTHSRTILSGGGDYQQVSTGPDGTVSSSQFSNGYLQQSLVQHPDTGILSQKDYAYDLFGRLLESTDVRNGTTAYSYYDDGQIHTITTPDPDPLEAGEGSDPQITEYVYQLNPTDGNRVTTILPDGTEQVQQFFPTGALQVQYGSGTYPVEYTYDHAGRVDAMTTWQEFDTETGTGISGSATTQWIYNPRGLLAEKRYDVMDLNNYTTGPSYTYTDSGEMRTRTWARGVTTTYGYAPLSRDLLSIDYSDTTPDVTYTYARSGRINTVEDASGRRNFSYVKGRTESELWTSGMLNGFELERGYDEYLRPRLTRLKKASTVHQATNYHYYADSRLRKVTAGGTTFSYTYHANSLLLNETTGSYRGQVTYQATRKWDHLNRLQSVTTATGIAVEPVNGYAYSYDALNRRQKATQLNDDYWDYDYDSLGQVESAQKKRGVEDTAMPGYDHNYTYDDIGNRLTSGPTNTSYPDSSVYYRESGASGSNGANTLNQYGSRTNSRALGVLGEADSTATVTLNGETAVRDGTLFYAVDDLSGEENADAARYETLSTIATIADAGANGSDLVASKRGEQYLAPNPEDFEYDADGNLTKDGRWHYTWNGENRLIAMETRGIAYNAGAPRQKLEFAYDSQGRRYSKKASIWDVQTENWETETWTVFLYDGWNLIAEFNALEASNFTRQTAYIWGLDLSGSLQGAGGVGGLLAVIDAETSSTAYPAFDGNGNVMGYYAADTGESLAEFEYDPFGKLIRATGSKKDDFNFRFSTKYQDAETELFFYGYRYYDATTGRWLSRDPINEDGGINLYLFNNNGAINYIDVLGMYPGQFIIDSGTDVIERLLEKHYFRNEILGGNCSELQQLRGRDDITDQELKRFVSRVEAESIQQSKNIFHQNSADQKYTNGDSSKFRNFKWVYGLLDGQNENTVKYRPCEFILRKNGCWKQDSEFEWDETWSWDSDPYTYGTANYGGDDLDHTVYDIVPWLFLGSAPEQTNFRDLKSRFKTLSPFK